jgi:hypothetical protein
LTDESRKYFLKYSAERGVTIDVERAVDIGQLLGKTSSNRKGKDHGSLAMRAQESQIREASPVTEDTITRIRRISGVPSEADEEGIDGAAFLPETERKVLEGMQRYVRIGGRRQKSVNEGDDWHRVINRRSEIVNTPPLPTETAPHQQTAPTPPSQTSPQPQIDATPSPRPREIWVTMKAYVDEDEIASEGSFEDDIERAHHIIDEVESYVSQGGSLLEVYDRWEDDIYL